MELDTHVLDKGRPLIDGWYTRLPIDNQLAHMLGDYSTNLCKYLTANGIQVENNYLDPLSRKSNYIILDSTSIKYITWGLSGYHLVVPDHPIGIHMDGSSGAIYGLQVRCNVIPCSTMDELLQQLRSTIDRFEGENLCDACHYSGHMDNKLCCGMGMVPTAHCIGYMRRSV
jgi:hypothetical protein